MLPQYQPSVSDRFRTLTAERRTQTRHAVRLSDLPNEEKYSWFLKAVVLYAGEYKILP
jgi:hypothetical protein